MSKNILSKSIINLPGVGKQKEKELNKLGIKTIEELLYYFPRRYEDRSRLKPLNLLQHDSVETILAEIKKIEVVKTNKKIYILKVYLENPTGKITAIFFNQNYLKNQFKIGRKIYVTGKVNLRFGRQIVVSDYELVIEESQPIHAGRIIPIYRENKKITSKFLRNLVSFALENYLPEVEETIPEEIKNKYGLLSIKEALREIHFPTGRERYKKARYRFVFEEFLVLQVGIKFLRQTIKNQKGISHTTKDELVRKLEKSLPFSLTDAQKKVISEIKKDMESSQMMYRLIQGDVGSGKTVVAAWAIVKAISGGYQSALMVPTEILAEQHTLTMTQLLKPLGIKPLLLKGGLSKKEKEEKLIQIATGKANLIIGTHSLIQSEVTFNNLGLVVIDEQHRFGVRQRIALKEKGNAPDVLVMTATPIPRTLALTFYGDMDLSVIDELPPGRKPVKTYHAQENMRERIYKFVRKQIQLGFQAYVVCPLVEESEKLDLENATQLASKLQQEIFPDYKIGLIHGRLNSLEKETIMEKFRQGKINVLVSTTVIEVGVNVPNATVMVIENAERFGLAQLHQLRGRIGRGSEQAYCILISDSHTPETQARMKIMTKTTNGFLLAEEDLKLRGPGEILGTRQHGFPDLKIANLLKDFKILEQTKILAEEIVREGLNLRNFLNHKWISV